MWSLGSGEGSLVARWCGGEGEDLLAAELREPDTCPSGRETPGNNKIHSIISTLPYLMYFTQATNGRALYKLTKYYYGSLLVHHMYTFLQDSQNFSKWC